MKRISVFTVLLLLPLFAVGQTRMRVMTWNVENLFDCDDDTLKRDEEFLPGAERQWTWGRFWRKVEDVSRVVMGVGGNEPPALVALQEVENEAVMEALTKRGLLRTLGYRYVMTESPDERGVDVALMYNPDVFRLAGWETRRVASAEHGLRPTRDLLHAWGRVGDGEVLHVVVCHLPSRAGGRKANRRNRTLALETLCLLTDSLRKADPGARVMVMGDFNAPLHDKALMTLRDMLHPLTPDTKRPTGGTYRFQGRWTWLDHIMVTDRLTRLATEARTYCPDWMKRTTGETGWYPKRTYLGTHYLGGVSDHLPIYCDIRVE